MGNRGTHGATEKETQVKEWQGKERGTTDWLRYLRFTGFSQCEWMNVRICSNVLYSRISFGEKMDFVAHPDVPNKKLKQVGWTEFSAAVH